MILKYYGQIIGQIRFRILFRYLSKNGLPSIYVLDIYTDKSSLVNSCDKSMLFGYGSIPIVVSNNDFFVDIKECDIVGYCGENTVCGELEGGVDCACKDGYEVPVGTEFPANCTGKHNATQLLSQ